LAALLASFALVAAPKHENSATPPTTFAPVPATNELASIWHDPEFTRRLIGSYGFASDAEPRMTPEELAAYRDKIVPLLREDPKKAIGPLEALVKPSASAVFDFTLGNVYFQNDDLTNAVKHFEAALAKFPDYRRAQKNLAFALVRDGTYAEAIKPLTRANPREPRRVGRVPQTVREDTRHGERPDRRRRIEAAQAGVQGRHVHGQR